MLPDFPFPVPIGFGAVPAALDAPRAAGVLWQAAPGALLLEVPDLARMLITRDRITVDPLVGNAKLGPFLRRTPLLALTLLRGGIACDASAVAGPDGAVLLTGRSASGKSALAAALIARGGRLLADDAAPILLDDRGAAMVHPVWPELVLWPDAVESLGSPDWLAAAPSPGFAAPLWTVAADRFCAEPMPIVAVYRLDGDRLESEPRFHGIRGVELFARGALMPYQSAIAEALVDPLALLRLYGAVAASARFEIVHLPRRDLSELDQLADRIAKECGWPSI
jgi:hypothetical protein